MYDIIVAALGERRAGVILDAAQALATSGAGVEVFSLALEYSCFLRPDLAAAAREQLERGAPRLTAINGGRSAPKEV